MAHLLQRAAVRHARRTDGFTSPAPETAVEMMGEMLVARRQLAPQELLHQHDAAAGTVGFVAGDQKRRAALEAETAVYAGIE
jgi:hypothetical protein